MVINEVEQAVGAELTSFRTLSLRHDDAFTYPWSVTEETLIGGVSLTATGTGCMVHRSLGSGCIYLRHLK